MNKYKNVLFLVHNYNYFQKDQIEALASHFENVHVLVRSNYIFKLLSFFFKSYKRKVAEVSSEISNIKVYRTWCWYLPWGDLYRLSGNSHANSVLKCIKQYNLKFDLIHAHFLWSAGYAGFVVKEKFKVPFVLTGHGYDVYELPKRSKAFKLAIVNVLKCADQIITVSKKNVAQIEQMGAKDNANIVYNGFNQNYFFQIDKISAREKLNLNLNSKIIISVGNLVSIKGQRYLIEAIARIHKENNEIQCYLIGEGPERKKLEDLIAQHKLSENFFLKGKLEHAQISQWMNAADLFCLSSLNEGNPSVLVESLACGLPFISTDVGGISEILIQGENGFLAEPANSQSLAIALKKGLENSWDLHSIAAKAQNLSWNSLSKDILKVYSKI